MPKTGKKLDANDLDELIWMEDMEAAVTTIEASRIANPELAAAWEEASAAIKEIRRLISDQSDTEKE